MENIKNKMSWGVVGSLLVFACILSQSIMERVGGIRTVFVLVVVFTAFAQYQKDDCPFFLAIRRSLNVNRLMMLFLAWYYIGVFFSALRGGMGVLVEWKIHLVGIISIFYGLFLMQNPKYWRLAVYAASFVLFYHALGANQYVSDTGFDMREALVDLSAALGTTDYWTSFSMLTIMLVGNLLEEKNKWIKGVGFVISLYLYKTILFCGFATPVALFIIGHVALGVIFFVYGKKGLLQVMIRLGFCVVMILGSIWSVHKISTMEEDSRFASIQWRFSNMIEDPRGGGYSVEGSRFDLAKISWRTFKDSPFFGCGGTFMDNPGSGGHQAVIDYLAIYGLLGGGGAFIVVVILCLRNTFLDCRTERNWVAYSYFSCAVMFSLVGIVNPGWAGWPMAMFMFYAHPFKRTRFVPPRPFVPVPPPHLGIPLQVPQYPAARTLPENRGRAI